MAGICPIDQTYPVAYRVPRVGELYIVPEEFTAIKVHPKRVCQGHPASRSIVRGIKRAIVRRKSTTLLPPPPDSPKTPTIVVSVETKLTDNVRGELKAVIHEAAEERSAGAYVHTVEHTEREQKLALRLAELAEAARSLVKRFESHSRISPELPFDTCDICQAAVARVEALINDNNEETQ